MKTVFTNSKHFLLSGLLILSVYSNTLGENQSGLNSLTVDSVNLQTGLVAYYPFNGNANDESGNGNNGTIQLGIINSSDRFGLTDHALSFPGATGLFNGNGVIVPNNSTLNFTDSYSISSWFKWGGTTSGINNSWDLQHIISKGRDVVNGYGIYILPQESLIVFYQTYGYGVDLYNYGITYTLTGIDLKNWHHVAGISDLQNQKLSLYMDGQLLTSKTFSGFTTSISNTNDLGIGLHNGDQGIRYPFNGEIDEARIYNRTINESEIQALYTEGNTLTGILDGPTETNESFLIYPNPNSGAFTMETSLSEPIISVINGQGIKIKTLHLPYGQKKTTIDGIPAGIYIVTINAAHKYIAQKVIIE